MLKLWVLTMNILKLFVKQNNLKGITAIGFGIGSRNSINKKPPTFSSGVLH
jgi:hypothetical protein